MDRLTRAAMIVSVCATGAVAFPSGAAAQGAPVAGKATLRPAGTDATVATAQQPFALDLPQNAACPGSSNLKGDRVQSYMVPASVDPRTLTFGSQGPTPKAVGGAFRQPLFATTTSAFVNAQTANAAHPDDPGTIVNVPAFSLGVFGPGDIPPGEYNIGIACTRGVESPTQLESYWNATFRIGASTTANRNTVAWSSPAATSAAAPAAAPAAQSTNISRATNAAASKPASSRAKRHSKAAANGREPTFAVPALALPFRIGFAGGMATTLLWIAVAAIFARLAIHAFLHSNQRRTTD